MQFRRFFVALFALATVSAHAQFVYVTNSSSSNSVTAFRMDPTTGALTTVAGSPFAAGSEPNSVVADLSGRFLYVTNESTSTSIPSTVSAYTIDPTSGALTAIAGSPFAAGVQPNSAKVHPFGAFLYVPNETSRDISVYTINPSTGTLAPVAGSPFPTGASTDRTAGLAFNRQGSFAYVTQNGSPAGSVWAFTVNTSTGALTPVAGSPFAAGDGSDSVIVDPSGRFVYVGNYRSNDISAFTINQSTGALAAIAGSPFAAGGKPDAITATGRFVYTANDSGPSGVGALSIDQTTGALTPIAGSPFAGGTSTSGITADPAGRFLFATNENSNDVSAYAIDQTTGVLTPVTGSAFATGGNEPGGIAVVSVQNVPALSSLLLALCGLSLAGLALFALRR
jgi:6-phosphogluconolactonase (cycloisomerase 2 family)